MCTLYISNIGNMIHLDMDNIHMKYQGPISLIKFVKINDFDGQVVSVETEFKHGTEEDYIDVGDVLSDYDYDVPSYLKQITQVELTDKGEKPMNNYRGQVRVTKKNHPRKRMQLIDESLMVSDNIALLPLVGSANDFQIEAVSMANTTQKCLVKFDGRSVLRSNMTPNLQKRALSAIDRNSELIVELAKERNQYA